MGGLRHVIDTEVVQIVDPSHVILKIRFSIWAKFEYLATIFTADILPFLFPVTVSVVVLEEVTCHESFIAVFTAEFKILAFNLRLESFKLLYGFVYILLMRLELGAVSELNIAKSAVCFTLNVAFSSVEPETVDADKLEMAQLTGILQHLLLNTLSQK